MGVTKGAFLWDDPLRINDPRSLGSNRGIPLGKDSSVPLMLDIFVSVLKGLLDISNGT